MLGCHSEIFSFRQIFWELVILVWKNDIVYGACCDRGLMANTGNKLYSGRLAWQNEQDQRFMGKDISSSWSPKKTLQEMTDGAVHQGFLSLLGIGVAHADLRCSESRAEENPLLLIFRWLDRPGRIIWAHLCTADATNVTEWSFLSTEQSAWHQL